MTVPFVLNSMVAGILFYTAYQFLFIGLRNSKHPEYITFGIIVLLQGICALIELFGVTSKIQDTYLNYRNLYYNITAAINFSFFIFISIVSGVNRKIWFGVYLISVALAFTLNNSIQNIQIVNHAAHYYSHIIESYFFRPWTVRSSPVFVVVNSLQFIIMIIFSLIAYRFHSKPFTQKSYFVLTSTFFFILGSLSDILIDMGVIHYPISSYFYLILVIYISNKLYKNIEKTKQLKDEVTQGEQQLRQIIDLVPNLIFAKDLNGQYILVNKALADIYGTTTDKLIGRSHGDLLNDASANEFYRQQDLEVVRTNKPILIHDESFSDKEGKIKIFETVKIPFSYMGSNAVLGVSSDVTAIKQSGVILKNNEKLLETIFDNASVAMVLVDQKSDVLKINKAGKELGLEIDKDNYLGIQPGNALNCIISHQNELGCGHGLECSACSLRKSMLLTFTEKAGVSRVPCNITIQHKDVVIVHNLLLSTSYLDNNYSPMGLMVFEDISSIAKAEQDLIDSEYRYKQISRAITDYIYTIIVHEYGEIQTIHTPACYFITGYNAEEFEIKPNLWFDIIVDEDREKVVDSIVNISEREEKHFIEHRIIRKDGSVCWVSNKLVRKKNSKKGILYYDGIIQDITERKHAEEALENQNKLLNTMLDNLPIGIFMVSALNGTPLISNEHARRLLGRGILPEASVENLSLIYKAYKAGTNQYYPIEETPVYKGTHGEIAHIDDLEVEQPNGTRTLLEIVGCPVYDSSNNIWAGLVGFYDITERKQAEQELKEAKEHLEMIFNTTPDAVWIIRFNDGTIINMNDGFSRITGYMYNEIINSKIKDERFYEYPAERQKLIEMLLGKGYCNNYEATFKRKDNSCLTGMISAKIINLKGVPHILCVTRDISDRKIKEDELRKSEEKFRNIFNSSNDAIMVTDFDSRILEANDICLKRTGFTLKQIKNLLLIDILEQSDRKEALFQFVNLSQNKSSTFQSSYINSRGEKIHIEVNGHLTSYDGKPAALLVSRDITERIVLQQKILNAIIEAEEKERTFFSQELHDGIGPILSTIKLYMQWIQNPEAKSNKATLLNDALNTVEEAIVSVKEISNRLSPNVLTKFGLEIAIQSFIKKIGNFGKVNFSLNINLPVRIKSEIETMLYRVLVEAINNSLKYAHASNINIQIDLEMDGIKAIFNDDGLGFNVEEVFSKKIGNGLFNMQNRVETYQGQFTLSSKPGLGTGITIFIPINKYEATANS